MQMTKDDLITELQKDTKQIKSTEICLEASNISNIYAKWCEYILNLKVDIIKAKADKNRIIKDRFNFYTGRSDDVCMQNYEKSELKYILIADPEVMRKTFVLESLEDKLEFCRSAIDAIKLKSYSIKNMIEYEKFQNGA